ncbi:uncharacterized protein LOC122505144 [Leptopilina heterotoma]|uniref:uncharacterized protein LOC122505144 n=1 Tax=Leptopilina heterotoma TaxID=63436 RepID=UPI001CA8DF8B|nr:uncharacterized protein LOC122505144 [Leptopilina heterotoma]
MNSFKMKRFLPNECYICKSRDNLKRCECNMISYCSEAHRLEHLQVHEYFCNVIKTLLIEKGLSHIYDEFTNLPTSYWQTRLIVIYEEIVVKLEREISPLEFVMFIRARVCFVCRQTKQETLTNCPHCPVASFCEEHPQSKIHSMNCKLINRYLNILNTAEEFNINLEFLSSTFPNITEETSRSIKGYLTSTYEESDMESKCLESRLLKMGLINFMDVASKLNNVLQKIYDKFPKKLLIHIDALSSNHVITKKNYWEFLLHLNPQIKKLKIVITQTEKRNNSKKSLCENCISNKKELIVEYLSKSYEDYILDENYQKPNILFFVKIVNEFDSESINKWSEFSFPVVLRFESNSIICEAQHFLSFSRAKFRFIFGGKLSVPFVILSSIENEDYFLILQSKGNKECQKSVSSAAGEINETNTPSTSKRSFAAISEPGQEEEGEKNKKSKIENCSMSTDKGNIDPNGEDRKIAKENDKVNSQSYLIEHISYLKKENEGLRQQLNLSVNEITKLQTKLDQVSSFDLNKILRGIVDSGETLQ